jgi:hypothetical protein
MNRDKTRQEVKSISIREGSSSQASRGKRIKTGEEEPSM